MSALDSEPKETHSWVLSLNETELFNSDRCFLMLLPTVIDNISYIFLLQFIEGVVGCNIQLFVYLLE